MEPGGGHEWEDMSGTHYRQLFRVYVDFVGAQELGYEWAGI